MSASPLGHDETFRTLEACLPGLRPPGRSPGLPKQDVHALLARIEDEVARSPDRAFAWSADGSALLTAQARTYRAGRFTTPSLGELEARVRGGGRGRLTLTFIHSDHRLTDIGALQAMAAPSTLFQVASQFNCLESPGPSLTRISDYVHDNTQGPRASVSAFPGTFLRHYAAPRADGRRFTQSATSQIDLLADAVPVDVASVRSGYLTTASVRSADALERALQAGFDRIRVGVHDGVEVVLGANWGGPVDQDAPSIAQAFTSTMALGGYSAASGDEYDGACTWLLRAAYLGTLLAALDLGKDTAVLTLIGGGAFGNSPQIIWAALIWAFDRASAIAGQDLRVVVNGRGTDPAVLDSTLRQTVRARGGNVIELPT